MDRDLDVASALRRLAAEIDDGKWGGVRSAGVVLCIDVSDFSVFTVGRDTVEVAGAFDFAAVIARARGAMKLTSGLPDG